MKMFDSIRKMETTNNHSIIRNSVIRNSVIRLFSIPHSVILNSVIGKARRAFTLLEVNLAICIMATGTLAICILYAFAFRESRQSVEDVASAAFADAYLGPLVQGLSATNMPWSAWRQVGDAPTSSDARMQGVCDGIWPGEGWKDYVDPPTSTDGAKAYAFRVKSNPRSTADKVFADVISKVRAPYKGTRPGIPSDYVYGLVVTRRGAVIRRACRAARRKNTLMSQQPFVAEVRFQGVSEE